MQRRDVMIAAALGPLAAGMARASVPGVTEDEILLGQSGVMTGPLGAPVKAMTAASLAAFKAVNEQGGVHGRRISLISLDDELNPKKAVENYTALMQDHKVFACYMGIGSPTTLAGAEVLKANGAVMVGGFGVADSVREKSAGTAFFVRTTAAREIEKVVDQLTTIGITRIACATIDNPGGAEVRDTLIRELQHKKLTPEATVGIKFDNSNVDDAARVLSNPKIQAVVMYLGGVTPGLLIKAVRQARGAAQFYGLSLCSSELTHQAAGEQARGTAFARAVPYPHAFTGPFMNQYRAVMEKAGIPVAYTSMEAFITASVMIQALQECGRDLTRAKLQSVIRKLKGSYGTFDFDFGRGQHTGSRYVELVQMTTEGKFMR